MNPFKVGQTVVVKANSNLRLLVDGTRHVIKKIDHGFVYVGTRADGWFHWRFEAVPIAARVLAPAKRAANGRFAAAPIEKPTVFRKSAIYKVKRKRGYTLAKYAASVLTKGETYVTMIAHGKPFLTRKANVSFANMAEVGQYLQMTKDK